MSIQQHQEDEKRGEGRRDVPTAADRSCGSAEDDNSDEGEDGFGRLVVEDQHGRKCADDDRCDSADAAALQEVDLGTGDQQARGGCPAGGWSSPTLAAMA